MEKGSFSMASDKTTNISELRDTVRSFIEHRDWSKYHNPKDVAISIAIEAAELIELFQWVKESELRTITEDPKKLSRLKEELADVMIYCLSLANVLNIDISQAISKKITENENKYPAEQVKGNYKKYTEI